MLPDKWNTILNLLSCVILIDKRVYQEEVQVFVKTSVTLAQKISPDMFITESMALDWFKANRDTIKTMLNSPHADRKVEQLIYSLSRSVERQDILNVMWLIAHADGDYHNTENRILKQAARTWNIKVPPK